MKNLWLVFVLVAAGAVILFMSLMPRQQAPQGVVMQEVFSQKPAVAGTTVKQEDPVVSPAIVTSPVGGHEEGFVIQVYSFQDHARAERALANLKAAGYQSFMEVSDLGQKGTWYRVRIAGIQTEAEAQKTLNDIRANYQSGFIVKPVKK